MEVPSREQIQRRLFEMTLARLRFDPEAHKDENGKWRSPARWSRAEASLITEVSSCHDRSGEHHLKLKLLSKKKVLRTAREILKEGRPRTAQLQDLYDQIQTLIAHEERESEIERKTL